MNSFSRFLCCFGLIFCSFTSFGSHDVSAAIDIPTVSAAPVSTGKPSANAVKVEAVEVQLVSNYDGKPPVGEKLKIGLLLKHDPHWHTYWRNPGDSGLATDVQWKLPEQWKVGPIEWPVPKRIPIGPLVNFGFEGKLLLPSVLEMPIETSGLATPKTIGARVQWLMCKDVCIPGEAELALVFDGGQVGKPTAHLALFNEAKKSAVQNIDQGRSAFKASFSSDLSVAKFRVPLNETSLMIDAKPGQEIDFFPYQPEIVQPAGALKVTLDTSESAQPKLGIEAKWADSIKLPELIEGLLVVNGKGYEVAAKRVSSWTDITGGPGITVISQYLGPQTAIATQSGAVSRVLGPDVSASANDPLAFTLVFAFLGGLILNLMPCVFPVLGLKVLGFASHSDSTSKSRLRAALLFAAGVIGSFWILALVMFLLQGAGQAVGWGFQLQSPWFVVVMAWLFALIGLNLTGVFEVGLSLTRSTLASKPESAMSEIGSGVLAVLVATPCTAPFMGAALGATLGQDIVVQFAVFTMLGLGMALPYVLLTVLPAAAKLLPRPGAWMQTLKHCLAFPMFATVAWLVWVFGQQLDIDAVLSLLLSLIVIGFSAWMYGQWQRVALQGKAQSKTGVILLCMTLIASLSALALVATANRDAPVASKAKGWEVWSPQRVDELLAQGKPVFVDFTAAWCVSCQVNKKAVLDGAAVKKFFSDQKITVLRADWTKRDPQITQELARYKRSGVPMYQVWLPTAGQQSATLLPELLTSDIVISAFK
jgi:thiol:disulfide interchange protein/DsbC/DsbD-like thiol-disulfide interchange protein